MVAGGDACLCLRVKRLAAQKNTKLACVPDSNMFYSSHSIWLSCHPAAWAGAVVWEDALISWAHLLFFHRFRHCLLPGAVNITKLNERHVDISPFNKSKTCWAVCSLSSFLLIKKLESMSGISSELASLQVNSLTTLAFQLNLVIKLNLSRAK